MTDLPGIVITGASGRMGRMLAQTILASDKAKLVGALERPGHDWIGRDLGEAMGGAANGVIVTDDPLEAFARAKAVISCSANGMKAGVKLTTSTARPSTYSQSFTCPSQ